MIVLYIILAILVLMLMIMIHELGHYLSGKMLGFKIEEFSIGFGKAIFSKQLKSGEQFSIRWIPLGGYCAFKGEDEDGKEDAECFNNYPCWKRLIVLFSGAFFNFLSAILFSFVLLMSVGSGIVQITEVTATNGNADKLRANDIVLEVDGVEPTFINGGIVKLMNSKDIGEDIVLKINRDGEIIDITVQKYAVYKTKDNGDFEFDSEGNKIIENKIIGVKTDYVRYGFGKALLKCVPYTFNMGWECLCVIGDLFTGKLGLDSVGGPITTIQTIAVSTQTNFKNLLLLFPLIAVNLAVFNWLPIPALDGARMVFVIIEWIFKKPVRRDIEAKIHSIGLMILFGLVIIIDLLHLIIF